MIELTKEKIDINKVRDAVTDPTCGAVVVFEGRVRNHHNGKAVVALEYEAYPKMVVTVVEQICEQAKQKWALGKVAVSHRYGRLEIGEVAVVVVVSSAHRQEAFEAASFIMDTIKKEAPIWKKEFYQDQTADWVFCSHGQQTDKVAGALLAGKSSRFGENKAFAIIKGKPFYQIGLDLLRPYCQEIYISSNEKELFQGKKITVVEDIFKEKGPLGGIYSLLKQSSSPWLLVVACDMPKITKKTLAFLLENISSESKWICFKEEEKIHPFPGLFHQDLIPKILNCLSLGELKVGSFIESLSQKEKKVICLSQFHSEFKDQFININTKKEFVKL